MARHSGLAPGLVLIFELGGLIAGEFIKWFEPVFSPLLVAALSVTIGAIPLLINYIDSQQKKSSGPDRWPPNPPPPRPSGTSFVFGLALLVTVGGGVAYGISWGLGYLTGNETPIADRLASPATGTASRLSITVSNVEITDHYTKVHVTAVNRSDTAITMPLFGYCQLIDSSGTTLKPLVRFGSGSPLEVPPEGIPVSEVITFDGKPTESSTTMTLAFTGLFPHGSGFTAKSLQVKGIELNPSARAANIHLPSYRGDPVSAPASSAKYSDPAMASASVR